MDGGYAQDLVIFNVLDARPCCPFRSFANPDAESSRVLVILFGCFFERLNSRVDAHHLSINISEPASPPTISISHSAVRSDSTLPSFRPHSRRRFTTFAIIAARTSVMTSAILANKLSKSCHAQVTPIQENGARLCPCVDKSENEGGKTLQMMASVSIT